MTTELYLIRHGEAVANVEPIIGGMRGDTGLTDLGREQCRLDVMAAVREAGRPLTRKEVVRVLKAGKKGHGAGTVAKALAELTAAGGLVNRRDKRGYRLPEWRRRVETPSLFD